MEYRALIAVILSILILVGFQFFWGTKTKKTPPPQIAPSKEIRDQRAEISEALPAKMAEQIQPPPSEFKPRDIVVDTALFKAILTERGGAIKHFFLNDYRTALTKDAPSVDLVNVTSQPYPLETSISFDKAQAVTPVFCTSDKEDLTLSPRQAEGSIVFSCRLDNEKILKKTYVFKNDSYLVNLDLEIQDMASYEGTISLYNKPRKEASSYLFEGPQYFSKVGLEEIEVEDEKVTKKDPVSWMGYGDSYFLTAIIPASQDNERVLVFEKGKRDQVVKSSLNYQAKDGREKFYIYFGPKDMNELKRAGYDLSGGIYFGWFDIIAKPLLYVLKFFYNFINNYGVAVILLTVLIKAIFWPLSHKSAKSMKTLQKLQPKMAKLKEKYGDDKARLNQELMQLYKAYKVNPASGCLPMVIQIPVFFALYKVLLQSIELRHAPFFLWINDLSAPDRLMIPGISIPYLGGLPILTILMGASMYYQQKMTPTAMDPTQAKIMQFLPLMFIFLFVNFPSGLVLYWLVNNVLSIAQQYYTNKFVK